MNRFIKGTMVAAILLSPGFAIAGNDVSATLQKDQQSVYDAQQNYKSAVMDHGATSDQAKSAMDKLDAAKNQLTIDTKRAQELQQMGPSVGVVTPSTATAR